MTKRSIAVTMIITALILPLWAGATSESRNSAEEAVTAIRLNGSGYSIDWETDGYSAQGYKVVWSKASGPTYPCRNGDTYHYYTDPARDSDTLEAFAGAGKYYVRVCEYLGGKCGLYSNEITLTLGQDDETVEEGPVRSIDLRVSGGDMVKWETDGYSAQGFKVLWSLASGPTYPLREGDRYNYHSDPTSYYSKLEAFAGSGTYYVRVCEYLGGQCGTYSNEVKIELKREEAVACTMEYDPVCGVNGKTYSNKCMLEAAGVAKKSYGACPTDEDIKKIEVKADKLSNNQLDEILAELQALRDLVKEQQTQITHLKKLLIGVTAVTEAMQNSINNFITYGVDENTKNLGEGERAAVLYSYKNAFKKLPENEDELADVIKIANGRWPGQTSSAAEERARELFRRVYLRDPDQSNLRDNAAVTIIAYGLRQRAENRNLESEKAGIRIFEDIFGHVPETTEDWNVMQAITYSGAIR